MNNQAIIARIKTYPHPDPEVNKIKLGNVLGYQVIVGIDTPDNELGIFFHEGLQLSEAYARANNLIRRKNPHTGEYEGGFFEENRRVKCLKLRQQRSEGYWAPLSSLGFTGYREELREGQTLDYLNGVPLCNKYVTPATKRAGRRGNKVVRADTIMFHRHFDTSQLRFGYKELKAGDLIILTLKMHGTSHRVGHVKDEIPRGFLMRAITRVFPLFPTEEWTYLSGSRNVVLEKTEGGYYSKDFRNEVTKTFINKLHKGETVYFEVVGFERENAPIMGSVSSSKLKDKEIKKTYGDTITYTYGCTNGQWDIYVYRITMTNEDGVSIDLPWTDVKKRCEQLIVKHVPEVIPPFIYDGDEENLRKTVEGLIDGPDPIDPSHPREGIVLRVDSALKPKLFKQKGFTFSLLEGIVKEQDDYVDIEEAS